MNSYRNVATLMVAMTVGISLPLEAQTLYRCGKSFQDRPCDSSVQGKVISIGNSATPATPQPAKTMSDIGCVQRGERAKKIMWAREVGKSKNEQLETSTSQDDRDLVEDVYRMRGSSTEVSAAIEARCDERLKAMPPSSSSVPENQRPSAIAPALQPSYDERETTAASKKNRCDSLAASLQNVRDAERTGGSARQMDSLKKQRRDVETQMQDAGC